MKKTIVFVIMFFVLRLGVWGAIVNYTQEIDPVIMHNFLLLDYGYPELGMIAADSITIPLPEFTLAPGDTLRVETFFIDEKKLMLSDEAEAIGFNAFFSVGGLSQSMSVRTNNGTISLEIVDSVNVFDTEQSKAILCHEGLGGSYEFGTAFWLSEDAGEIVDGAVIGGFVIEFTVPTTIDRSPFSRHTYDFNNIIIESFLETDVDQNLLLIVPEPATFLMMAMGIGLSVRRKKH